MHYTLFNSARMMRAYTGLPPNRWDEFILTANYLHMRVPTKSLNNKTPYEAYYRHKPDLTHLREIGSRAFVLILNKHNPKVFQRSEECVLIGYGKDSKLYRCYHRATHKVFESFHVVFIESKAATSPNLEVSTTPSIITIPIPSTPSSSFPATQPAPSTHIRRSSHIPNPSSRSAKASGLNKLSSVQRATLESIASKTCVDLERKGRRSQTTTNEPTIAPSDPNPQHSAPSSLTKDLHDLAEVALRAMDDLSDRQTADITEQLWGDGFEWGLLPESMSRVQRTLAPLPKLWLLLMLPNG